jgi:hypothetical protein
MRVHVDPQLPRALERLLAVIAGDTRVRGLEVEIVAVGSVVVVVIEVRVIFVANLLLDLDEGDKRRLLPGEMRGPGVD